MKFSHVIWTSTHSTEVLKFDLVVLVCRPDPDQFLVKKKTDPDPTKIPGSDRILTCNSQCNAFNCLGRVEWRRERAVSSVQ